MWLVALASDWMNEQPAKLLLYIQRPITCLSVWNTGRIFGHLFSPKKHTNTHLFYMFVFSFLLRHKMLSFITPYKPVDSFISGSLCMFFAVCAVCMERPVIIWVWVRYTELVVSLFWPHCSDWRPWVGQTEPDHFTGIRWKHFILAYFVTT